MEDPLRRHGEEQSLRTILVKYPEVTLEVINGIYGLVQNKDGRYAIVFASSMDSKQLNTLPPPQTEGAYFGFSTCVKNGNGIYWWDRSGPLMVSSKRRLASPRSMDHSTKSWEKFLEMVVEYLQ
jgi:hypothetical protein